MQTNAYQQQMAQAIPVVLEQLPGWSNVAVAETSATTFAIGATVLGREVKFNLSTAVLPPEPSQSMGTVAAWISPKLAQVFRDQGQSYMDTAGNIFFNFPGLYVLRENSTTPLVDLRRKRPRGETFSPTATRVGLYLLMDPKLVQATLRDIAAVTDVSLPSVKLAMDAFKADGYIMDAGKRGGKRFGNREKFFLKWVEGYNERLRPKLKLGRFTKGVTDLQLEAGQTCWGGDQATKAFVHGLRSDESVIYAYNMTKTVILKNRLRPDPEGDIVLLQAAWKQDREPEPMNAPAFVVYADLIHARDPRCQEVAQQLLEQKIRGTLDV